MKGMAEDSIMELCDNYALDRETVEDVFEQVMNVCLEAGRLSEKHDNHFIASDYVYDEIMKMEHKKLAFMIYGQIVAQMTK